MSIRHILHNLFFFNDTATTEIYTLSLHDALPISSPRVDDEVADEPVGGEPAEQRLPEPGSGDRGDGEDQRQELVRSEEHTSELQSQSNLVCRLLLEKKKKNLQIDNIHSVLICRCA